MPETDTTPARTHDEDVSGTTPGPVLVETPACRPLRDRDDISCGRAA